MNTPLPPIVYQDDALIAFDKPSGLLSVADRWDRDAPHLLALVQGEWPTAVNVHRLDRETSGIVVFALDVEALRGLSRQFEEHTIEKVYGALVSPPPLQEQGRIDAPLGEDPARPGAMRVDRQGKPSVTQYEVLESFPSGHAWLALWPETGRTHQLRVHLQILRSPIVADPLYGDGQPLFLSSFKRRYKPSRHEERPILERLALHAAVLRCQHPLTGEPLEIEAPLPHDLELTLKQLRRYTR